MKTIKNKKQARKNKSFKGKRGHQVGAPPKATKFPTGAFTMATAFKMNGNQCHLSVRKKVDALLASGGLIQLKSRKQAKGGVGRPKAVFVKAENFDAAKMERLSPEPTALTAAIPITAPADVVQLPHELPAAPETPAAPAPAPFDTEKAREYVEGLDVAPPAPVTAPAGELVAA